MLDKPFYLGFAVFVLSKLHTYETYYDKLQPYYGERNLHLYFKYTDSFILGINTEDIIKEDVYHVEDLFDFSNLDENHEFFSNKNNKMIGTFKLGTPQKYLD